MRRLGQDDPRLELRARAWLTLLEDGSFPGIPLDVLPSYGDLSDCRKIYFKADEAAVGPPTHRIVYRETEPEGPIEVVEVVAVEERDEGYVYLLAAERLGRLPEETQPRAKRVHQQKIAQRGERRKQQRQQQEQKEKEQKRRS